MRALFFKIETAFKNAYKILGTYRHKLWKPAMQRVSREFLHFQCRTPAAFQNPNKGSVPSRNRRYLAHHFSFTHCRVRPSDPPRPIIITACSGPVPPHNHENNKQTLSCFSLAPSNSLPEGTDVTRHAPGFCVHEDHTVPKQNVGWTLIEITPLFLCSSYSFRINKYTCTGNCPVPST